MGVQVRPLDNAVDPAGCDAVIRSLPYFFGDENGIREAARAARTQEGRVAADGEDVVGFVTMAPTFPGCLEITWLAVRADRRRSGLGRELVERVAARAIADGIPLLCVLTLGPSVEEPASRTATRGPADSGSESASSLSRSSA